MMLYTGRSSDLIYIIMATQAPATQRQSRILVLSWIRQFFASLFWTLVTFSAESAATANLPDETQVLQVPAESHTSEDERADEDRAKPWLITPTLSADPKLGTNIGGVVAYLKKLDKQSTASMIGATVSYSDTDPITGGVGAQLFWGGDARRLILLAGAAEINNEYDDFLGTGQTAETQDSVHAVGFRYLQQIGQSDWLAGVQGLSTNYAVGAEGYIDGLLNIIGLSGFDATGLGFVVQHDTVDSQRDPTNGHLYTLHNMAYRESLGGEASFDVVFSDFRWYRSLDNLTIGQSGRPPVFALQMKGRFTEDAPLSGFSSVSLPGYTMGNYLSEDYAHLLLEG